MAQAIVITLEGTPADGSALAAAAAAYAKGKTGKALARESDRLDFAARVRSAASITSLVSQSPDEVRRQMQESGIDPTKMRVPPELWYDAAEGLRTVRALAEYVSAKLNDFKQPNPILRDLKAAEALLTAAEAAKVRFHFTRVEM